MRTLCASTLIGEFFVIGFAGLKWLVELGEVDLGYRFLPAYWGVGLATEAGEAVLRYGFERLGLRRVIGLVMPENTASIRVLEKLGLRFDGLIEDRGHRVARYVIEAKAMPRTSAQQQSEPDAAPDPREKSARNRSPLLTLDELPPGDTTDGTVD